MRRTLTVLAILLAGAISAVAIFGPETVGTAAFNVAGPIIWPYAEPYFKNFPPSPNQTATVRGSYPTSACQNSHVDWGEKVRRNQSLDGMWDVTEGPMSDSPPETFDHRAPVPGLLTEAEPAYLEVGVASDRRQAFWYRTSFRAPQTASAQAFLCLQKAKYGARVWLNGEAIGQHYGAFTLSEYDLSSKIRFGEDNELLIRVGADRSQIPEFIPAGADLEKHRWYPGLWDSVSVVYTGPVTVVRTKVESDIERGIARARVQIRNSTAAAKKVRVSSFVSEWPTGLRVSQDSVRELDVGAGQTIEVVQELPIQNPRLWSPESPALYLLHTSLFSGDLASDDRVTRFGMREMIWRGGEEKGFYLNGRRYYLRGTNIAFHRFLEDQDRRRLPWDPAWVTRLLATHPKRLGWNSFRFHIGRAPNFWYDLADEIGLIVTDEFHIFAPVRVRTEATLWSLAEMKKEYTGWVQENWNHPSIGWWDAANETNSPLPYELVPSLRDLDETRQWESGSYGPPDRKDDPMEEHPYMLNAGSFMNANEVEYSLEDLDSHSGQSPQKSGDGLFSTWNHPDAASHPFINNEYGWLWHTRDGSQATTITEGAFERHAPGVDLTNEERHELYAYLVSELTAFWRSRRGYEGVQHFLYLGKCTDPDTVRPDWEAKDASATCDNFVDVPNLILEPRWAEAAKSAFAPVMIYLEKWSNDFYRRGEVVSVPVSIINDEYGPVDASVILIAATPDGKSLSESPPTPIRVPTLGTVTPEIDLRIPGDAELVLYAILEIEGRSPTVSRRKLRLAHPGVLTQSPLLTP